MYYIRIHIEDIVANAFIEMSRIDNRHFITYKALEEYSHSLCEHFNTEHTDKHMIQELSRNRTQYFFEEYHDWFEETETPKGAGIQMNENITIDMLWDRFRSYLTFDILKTFMNEDCTFKIVEIDGSE